MRTKLRRLVPDALCAIPALVVVLLAAHGSLGIRVGTAASAPSQDGQGPQLPLAAAFTDDPLVPGVTQVRAVHVTELRSRIDSLRVLRRLRTFGWAEPALNRGVPIRAVHLLDLRTALADAYIAVGLPAPAYSGPALTAGGMIRAAHITELRAAIAEIDPLLAEVATLPRERHALLPKARVANSQAVRSRAGRFRGRIPQTPRIDPRRNRRNDTHRHWAFELRNIGGRLEL
jgi:hypothetical protein